METKPEREYQVSMLNLLVIFFTIFICPLFSGELLRIILPLLFLLIFLLVSLTVSRYRRFNLLSVAVFFTLLMVSMITGSEQIRSLVRVLEFLFFMYLLVLMVMEVARTRTVSRQVIIDAVTGYFLLGLAYANLVIFTATVTEGAYNLGAFDPDSKVASLNAYIYYSFVTYTTTGYGDLLPTNPLSRSLAILIGVSGQLYIAIIIAMLVGKFSNRKTEANP